MTAVAPALEPPTEASWRSKILEPFLWAKFGWAIFLSVFALSVYVGTSRIVEHRSYSVTIPTFYFQWERHLPFVPLMAIPYWSVDLVFFFAPLVCTGRREVHAHVKRMVVAVIFACTCFLLFPLREAFERPPVEGLPGALFRMLMMVDRPFNMAPSLHIVEVALLWVIYSRHTSGWMRRGIQAWLLLIAASTVLTFQHHIIDVITGQGLAMLCFYFFPDLPSDSDRSDRAEQSRTWNVKVGKRYAGGAVIFAIIAMLFRPWGLLLLWPSLTLAIMASAYFGLGARVFRKNGPRLSQATRAVMFPYLLGDRVAFAFYRRAGDAFSQIAPGLWIGRRLSNHEARMLLGKGVTAVLDLSAECSETSTLTQTDYRSLPVLDLTTPTCDQLQKAVEFIRSRINTGGVYVHCTMGFSRSAAVAAAWMLAEGKATDVEQAIEMVRAVRPHVRLGQRARAALSEFESR